MRLVASIFAVLGLWLLSATAAPRPTCLSGAAAPASPDTLAAVDVAAGAVLVAGVVDDWDDETKPGLPRCEATATPRLLLPAAAIARLQPRPPDRAPDRRTATLVGTVVLLI